MTTRPLRLASARGASAGTSEGALRAAATAAAATVAGPAAVDTPSVDRGEIGPCRGRDFCLDGQGSKHPLDAGVLARRVLAAVVANEAMVVEPRRARLAWPSRLSPT
ncbi:hypothetical protein, partial [Actinomadura sp. BRA 177]|uniref:hypothetical protein n=1 Tax=Actinomadura sp. BRA 177 TaxID=2745202 RepID=UPI0017FCB6D7